MLRCCKAGRLPPANIEFLEHILLDPHHLPKPREIAEAVHFTNAQREQHKLWTIPPTDMSKARLARQRREKDKQRKMLARRKAHIQTRGAYLAQFANSINKTKPWLNLGMSRADWYRKGKPTSPPVKAAA
jgi:hypothetical protein